MSPAPKPKACPVDLGPDGSRADDLRTASLWLAALAIALAVHLGLASWLLRRPLREGAGAPEIASIPIEFAPASAPDDAPGPPQDSQAAAGEPDAAAADQASDAPMPPPAERSSAPETVASEAAPAAPLPSEEAGLTAPISERTPDAEMRTVAPRPDTLPERKPPLDIRPPAHHRPSAARPSPPPSPLHAAKPRSTPRGVREADAPVARSASGSRAAAGQASPGGSAGNAASAAAWRARIQAYLQSRFRAPAGSGTAAVQMSFTVLRSGQIAGARVARGSGAASLDAAALAAFGGGVPPPPPDVPGSSFAFNIRFVSR